jgi:hypothetical protein
MPYSTKSLLIASFLYASPEVEFKGTDKSDPQNILFKFEPNEKAEDLVDAYYTDTGLNCNAKMLFESQKNLKDLIFETKRQSSA